MTLKAMVAALAVSLAASVAVAGESRSAADLVSNLLSVRSATYDFIQFGPKGD